MEAGRMFDGRHARKESDSRRLENLIIIPTALLLPLLPISQSQAAAATAYLLAAEAPLSRMKAAAIKPIFALGASQASPCVS